MSEQGWKPRSRGAPYLDSPKCDHTIENWHCVNNERWICRMCEPQAEAGGTLRSNGDGAVTIKVEAGAVHIDRPHVATLPTGERVELPAGTVLREGTLPPEAEDDRPTLGEQIHDEHDRALRNLTERVGLPREMAPSVAFLDGFNEGMKAAQAEAAGGMATSTIAEAFRLAIGADGGEAAASVEPGPEART